MTGGGTLGTTGAKAVTNGGSAQPSGEALRRARRSALLAYLVLGAVFAVVNAASELDERSRAGRPVDAWEPWFWEFSSLAGFLLVAPAIVRLSQRLSPPRLSWPATAAAHLLLTVPASLVHVGVMLAARHAVYAALGDRYEAGGPLFDVLVYEYRKDLITYAVIALLPHIAAKLLSGQSSEPATEPRLEVRDGTRTVRLAPSEIDWAQAAGNYVELRGPFGSLLHRVTLSALEEELGSHGFVRVHRSRLVRVDSVRAIQSRPSGDFDVTLLSGETIGGSRRYRENLD